MEQQYREMFDEVRSSSRLQEEVRKMSEMERKPAGRRFPRKILMVAAVLAVLAGTAVAAVGAPGTLRGWFAQEWEETTGSTMDEEQLALIDRLTQPVGVSDTQNGVTVTVDSATIGNSTVWLLVKVSGEYTENTNFRYHFDSIDMTLDPDPDEVGTPGGYGFEFPYAGVSQDGTLTMLVQYTIDLAGQSSLLDEPRQVTLLLDDLVCNDMTASGDEDVVLAEGHWTLPFSLEPGEAGTILTMEELQAPAMDLSTQDIRTVTLRDVVISATDITYVQLAEDQEWSPLKCALVLEDGSQVNWSSGSSRFRDEASTQWSSVYYWRVPVDLSKVTALRFGDVEIPLN